MSFVVTGSGIDSAECRELRARWRERVRQYDDMDATLKFETEDAFIEFQNNGRTVTPYLMLMGRPVSVEGDFPWGVSGVEYANKLDRQLVAYRYELTRENLADMAAKGMFEPGFETPEVLRRNLFELPCTVSCVAVGPESESDFPVVFVSLNPGSLVCDDNMSGYTIHEYFEHMPEQEPEDLVYESAVARTLPYENAFDRLGKKLQVPEASAESNFGDVGVEQDAGHEIESGKSEKVSDNTPKKASESVSKPVEAPVVSQPGSVVEKASGRVSEPTDKPAAPVEKIDRKAEVEKMGGPDDSDKRDFLDLDSEYE